MICNESYSQFYSQCSTANMSNVYFRKYHKKEGTFEFLSSSMFSEHLDSAVLITEKPPLFF